MRSGALLALIAIASVIASAQPQNLVPNGGFEEYRRCPGDFSESAEEFAVVGWRSASRGTPDHFHSCSAGDANVPHNWAGVADAWEGDGYAGIYVWMSDDNQYREYLQCKLAQPLIEDSTYHIGFRYKLSSYSKYAVDRIGMLLTDSLLAVPHDRVLHIEPTMSVIQDSALTKQTGLWEKAFMTYKAHGGESFLTIGNFFDNGTTRDYEIIFRPVSQPMLARSAYYYVDDVQVIPAYDPRNTLELIPEFALPGADLNTTYVLENVRFEFDSYKLVFSSFEELDQVVSYMMNNPNVKVILSGHTDDLGSAAYNHVLSTNRAKTVAQYLTYQGIGEDRIEVFGFGKSHPLINERTEYARSLNRRVEIRFVR